MFHSVVLVISFQMDVPLAKKTVYKQRYKVEWEKSPNFKQWLKPVPGDDTRAKCLYCRKDFLAKLSDIQRHCDSVHHKKQAKPFLDKKQTQISSMLQKPVDKLCVEAEGALSMYVAEHTAIQAIDHLTELCKNKFSDSKATTEMKLHRTKCTAIIQEVLAPHFKDSLRNDIGDNSYSLIIDESTDVSIRKYLGIVVKYFSSSRNEIVSTFLGLVELESADAEGIVSALTAQLEAFKLDKSKLIGIGTDNASVMTGVNAGVHKILQERYALPNLVLIKCVCHSIQLAVSHASCETIPRNIEFMIRETHNWFKLSPKRKNEYKKIYEAINCGEEPLKILKACDTRWLSIEPAVTRILSQWIELKLHFQLMRTRENCYQAELLYNMYNDERNKIYLQFLCGILQNLQGAIKTFENKTSDPCLLYNTLHDLIRNMCTKIIIAQPRMQFESINVKEHLSMSPYLGYLFEKEMNESSLNEDEKNAMKMRCVDFIIKLINELQQRLPENLKLLKNSMALSVSVILKPNRNIDNFIQVLESLGYTENMDNVIQQWQTVILQNWENTEDTVKFWTEVQQSRDAAGCCPYKDLFNVATKIMSLPHSNADIERVFSLMNVVKSKLRNALHLKTINAILFIRTGLTAVNSNCYNYQLPADILSKIGSSEKYKVNTTEPNQPGPSSSAMMEEEF